MAKVPRKTLPTSISVDDPVTAWALEVVAGRVVAGPHVRNAARRHLDDLTAGPARGLTWDLTAARRAIGFFHDMLRLAQGKFEGQPFILHPPQQFIIGSIFGWKKADGFRRFRRVYIEQGKGSGKSPLAAGIGMYCLLADSEPQAEVYAGASMKSQAMVIFRAAVNMWRQSPALSARLTPSGGNPIWNLADLKTGSFFRPISTDEAHSGPMPSCALLDELHEHRSGHMTEVLERGFKSRRQPLLIMITNSGSDRQSVCWQEHQHAIRVAAGTMTPDAGAAYVGEPVDDTAFSFVCSLDLGDDPLEDPSCWVKANPLLDVTMPREELARAVAQAKAIPGKMNNILRLHFGVWTDSETAWMARPALEACLDDFDPAEHTGEKVHVGLDLSATQDLTSMAFVVPTGTVEVIRDDGTVARLPTFDAWVEAWTPGDTLRERALRDETPYDIWVKDGWLHEVPGRIVRFDFVVARLAEIAGQMDVADVAYDQYAFRKHFEPEMDAQGLTLQTTEHPQGGKKKGATGLWMPGSKSALELLMLERRIRLRRSPLLIAAMMSAATEEDPFGNSWFSKRKATARIDALVALAIAVGSAVGTDAPIRSVYDSEEAYQAAFGPVAEAPLPALEMAGADDGRWAPDVLANPADPRHVEHRRRFSEWQEAQGDD